MTTPTLHSRLEALLKENYPADSPFVSKDADGKIYIATSDAIGHWSPERLSNEQVAASSAMMASHFRMLGEKSCDRLSETGHERDAELSFKNFNIADLYQQLFQDAVEAADGKE